MNEEPDDTYTVREWHCSGLIVRLSKNLSVYPITLHDPDVDAPTIDLYPAVARYLARCLIAAADRCEQDESAEALAEGES